MRKTIQLPVKKSVEFDFFERFFQNYKFKRYGIIY